MSQHPPVFAIVVAATAAFAGYGLISWFKDWRESDDLHLAFKNFHDKHTREPREIMTRAKRIHRDFMLEIERTFRRNGICHHLEYTGNTNKGVTVRNGSPDDDLKSDVMLVIDKHEYDLEVLHDDTRPGYAWLKINRGAQPSPELDKVLKYWNIFGYIFAGDLYVDPYKTLDMFFSELQKLINESYKLRGKVILSRYDSAAKLDIYPNSGFLFWGPRLYSVDLVPAYQVGGAMYVSKPLKEEVSNRMTWRRSFSIQEKHNPSGGPKYVLLILEAVLSGEPGLAPLTSYHLKTALMYEMDAECDWSDRALVLRFLGVLGQLETSLDNGNLPDYFIPEINLLSLTSPTSMRNVSNRIQTIRSSKNELMNIFKS